MATRIAERVEALLRRRLPDGLRAAAPDASEQLQAASVLQLASLGERAGRKTRRRGGVPRQARDERGPVARAEPSLCALAGGWSVHAGRRVEREDRLALERLCRYGLRGPLAGARLEELPGGRLAYHLAHAAADGSTMLVLEPLELLEKLAALVPKAREHAIHFHGILSAHAERREEVIPSRPRQPAGPPAVGGRTRRRLSWAQLLRRVFALEVLTCALCGGRRRVIAAIEKDAAAQQILKCLGLPTEPPERAPARGPPQGELGFGPAPPEVWDQRTPDVA